MSIPDKATAAVANDMHGLDGCQCDYLSGDEGSSICGVCWDRARAALEAAMPEIREAIAQEIDAMHSLTSRALGHVQNPAFSAGLDAAATVVRRDR